jgi:hypothetical protein
MQPVGIHQVLEEPQGPLESIPNEKGKGEHLCGVDDQAWNNCSRTNDERQTFFGFGWSEVTYLSLLKVLIQFKH